MPRFLNTLGRSVLGIAICARCSRKFPIDELVPDGNIPGLMVCKDDRDDFDPYRLPALQDDRLILPFVRPDEELTAGVGPTDFLAEYLITQGGDPFVTQGGDFMVTSP